MSRSVREALDYCTYCPKLCRDVCPVSNAERNEATTPWGKMSAMGLLEEGKLPWERPTTDLAYKCTQCRQCLDVCEHDNPVGDILNIYRSKIYDKGLAPEVIYEECKKFYRYNNPFERDLHADLEKSFPEHLNVKSGTVYFPGCHGIRWGKDVIKRFFNLMDNLGVQGIGLYAEPIQCCGTPLLTAGDHSGFRDQAEVNYHAMKQLDTIIVGCTSCYRTMSENYVEQGFDLGKRVVHIIDFLKEQTEEHNYSLKKNIETDVILHDGCAQECGVAQDLIQDVVGVEPQVVAGHHGFNECCGHGAHLSITSPDTAKEIVEQRKVDFLDLAPKENPTLITTSVMCEQHFKANNFPATIINIVNYLDSCIEKSLK